MPQVLRKRTNKNSKLAPYSIKEIQPLSSVYVLSAWKRKLAMEEIEMKNLKIEYLEKSVVVKEEHKSFLANKR